MSERVDQFLLSEISRHARASGEVLDLPCGDGALSKLLDAAGFSVTPADLFPEALSWAGRTAVAADMNRRLPFDDDRFDAVVSQEGVEHLEHLASFVSECARVLRPGGQIWITTPNFMDLSSRLSFFLTGMKSFHAGFPNEVTTLWGRDGERVYHGHAFTLPFFQVRYLLRVFGFERVALHGLKRSTASTVLYVPVRPLAGILVSRAFRKIARKADRRRENREVPGDLREELRRFALSGDLLCFRKICVHATLASSAPGT